ncbi:MAG: F(420)H(2) dehydrogenase subunit C [Methanoregula sp. PtaU1.Bin051]|nr:MAG: F(420)H(2) dehydrogenase subunit C [Methanoregula sp. PtaU1.Bin051]
MNKKLTLEEVTGKLGRFGTVEQARFNRIRVSMEPDTIRDAIIAAQGDLACERLLAISTADNTETLELIYHLIGPHRTVISLATRLPSHLPKIRTISDILPPAGIYERQIHDLFGITFDGHPGLNRLMLNEDWPEGEYPLRKDWKPEPGRFYGGIREDRS